MLMCRDLERRVISANVAGKIQRLLNVSNARGHVIALNALTNGKFLRFSFLIVL